MVVFDQYVNYDCFVFLYEEGSYFDFLVIIIFLDEVEIQELDINVVIVSQVLWDDEILGLFYLSLEQVYVIMFFFLNIFDSLDEEFVIGGVMFQI